MERGWRCPLPLLWNHSFCQGRWSLFSSFTVQSLQSYLLPYLQAWGSSVLTPRNLLGYKFITKSNRDPVRIRMAIPGGATSNFSITSRAPNLLPVVVGGEQSTPGSWWTPLRWQWGYPLARRCWGGKAFGDVVQLFMRCFKGVVGMHKTCYGMFRGRVRGGSVEGTSVGEKGIKGTGPG